MTGTKVASKFWLSTPPRIFAHRGLALQHPENTLEAFQHALAVGADYLETDLQATKDGVAVVFHDTDLKRLFARNAKVGQLSWSELSELRFPEGEHFLSFEALLDALPKARFNIDIKDSAAAKDAARVIVRSAAWERVLITSFSPKRRKETLKYIRQTGYQGEIATSAGNWEVLLALISAKTRFKPWGNWALREVDSLQIPQKILGIRTDTPRMIHRFHQLGVGVYFWTVNDPEEMARLLANGADGIVTDRTDLAINLK